MSKPLVGIVILNYNSYELTNMLIDNIHDTISYDNYHIVVVDNCSTNDSATKIAQFCDNLERRNVTLIAGLNNGGYAAGNNIGIKQAELLGAEYVLVVNNDVIFTEPKTLDILVYAFEHGENVGAVTPKLMKPDEHEDPPIYYKRPSAWELSFGYYSYVKEKFKQHLGDYNQIYAPRGSCMMLKTSVMRKIDYLDEHTFLYYEEPILAEKLIKIQNIVLYVGAVSVIHNHAQTISSNLKSKFVLSHIAKSMRFYLKEYRKFSWLTTEMCVCVKKITYKMRH